MSRPINGYEILNRYGFWTFFLQRFTGLDCTTKLNTNEKCIKKDVPRKKKCFGQP